MVEVLVEDKLAAEVVGERNLGGAWPAWATLPECGVCRL